MNPNRKIINQGISILMLLIYLFGSSSILLFHNHHNHHHDLSFCENFYLASSYDSDCSHDSHIISLKERCTICDHLSNFEPVILDSKIKSSIELFSVNWGQLFVSLYLDDSTNTLNKSPPFII